MANIKMPENKERDFFGLIIDESEIKLVSMSQPTLGARVESFNCLALPQGIIEGGRITNIKRLSEVIKELCRKAKPKPCQKPFCVIGLPENQIFVQTITVSNQLSDPEISRVIEQKTSKMFPIPYKDITLDWQTVSRDKKEKKILIIAAPTQLIDSIVEAAMTAGIQPIAVEPKSFALHRLLSYIQRRQALILIDLEKQSGSLSIYYQGEIKFHTKIGTPLTVNEIAGGISRTLHYYQDKYGGGKPIRRVIFSGDIGEKQFLEEIGRQFKNIQVEKITLPEFNSSDDFNEKRIYYASTIALSLKKINIFEKHREINLLPTKLKNSFRVNLVEVSFGVISRGVVWYLLFLVGILGIFAYNNYIDNDRLTKLVESKENFQISKSLKQKEEMIKIINRKSSQINQLHQQEQNIPSLTKKLIGLSPTDIELNLIEIEPGQGTIIGIGSRADIIKYKDRLAGFEKINQVDLPLSSLEKQTKSEFSLRFTFSN